MWQSDCQWGRFENHWLIEHTNFSESDDTEAYDTTDVTHVDSSITKRKRKIDDTENYENIIQLTTDTEILLTEDEESLFSPIISKSKRKRLVENPIKDPIQISQKFETSLSCTICNITFTRKDNLKRHNVRKHWK